MTDIWVCDRCHSINRQRDTRCYKCGAKQEQASGPGLIADVRTEQAILARARVRYRSSFLRFLVAAAFIVAYAVLGIVVLVESLPAVEYLREQVPALLSTGRLDEAELLRQVSGVVIPALAQTVCGIGALLFFAAWLSRVVMNIPALGGGTPSTTPTKAFIYPLIPFWNLWKVPSMVQNAIYRLDPKAGGFFMILLAWIGLVGSAIVGFLAGWWVNLRLATIVPRSYTLGDAIAVVESAYDMQVLVDVITTLMASFGAIVLVLVMFRIEGRARARDREIRKAAATPQPEPGTVAARPGAVTYEAAAASGAAAAARARSDPPPDAVQERSVLAATGRPEPEPEPGPSPSSGPWSGPSSGPGPSPSSGPSSGPPSARTPGPGVPASPTPDVLSDVGGGPRAAASTGPRLTVVVDSDGGIVAGLEGESETVTLDELRAAAAALANAGGTAAVTRTSEAAAARWTARWVATALRDAGVPTDSSD